MFSFVFALSYTACLLSLRGFTASNTSTRLSIGPYPISHAKALARFRGCASWLKMQSSRPSIPCLPPHKEYFYRSETSERIAWGEKARLLVEPLTRLLNETSCKGFTVFHEYSWCKKAFVAPRVLVENSKDLRLGLSFGIETRDEWSERLSRAPYQVKTKLFDCYQDPFSSVVMAGKAQNGTKPCMELQKHCYDEPHQIFQTCLSSGNISKQRKWTTVEREVRGWTNNSVFLKMDVEGFEWDVLEELLQQPLTLAKIRTLDMELHFLQNQNDFTLPRLMKKRLGLLEKLKKHFFVVGSTLEWYREGWTPKVDCPKKNCVEPKLHLAGGMGISQIGVSYVKKEVFMHES